MEGHTVARVTCESLPQSLLLDQKGRGKKLRADLVRSKQDVVKFVARKSSPFSQDERLSVAFIVM